MQQRPRSPGVVYGAVTLVLIALLAAVALTVRQTPPPTISEFAPQAVERISDPSEDSSLDSNARATPISPAAELAPPDHVQGDSIDVPRVRRCVGDPPRQIEDPQSPPCVPYWTGDNGGATTKGATRDEVRIAIDNWSAAPLKTFASFFNTRFEFYGRKLRLIEYASTGASLSPAQMSADAARVDEEYKPFAAVYYNQQQGGDWYFYDELARRRVIGVMIAPGGIPFVDEAHLARLAPYEWNYTMAVDEMLANYAEFWCNGMAGRPARFGGPPQSSATRKLGVIVHRPPSGLPPPDMAPLAAGLRACGEQALVDDYSGTGNASDAATSVLRMQQAGVTSVLFAGHGGDLALALMPAATSQGYHPEWLISNFGHQDDDYATQYYPADQGVHAIGLAVHNKQVAFDQLPSHHALRQTDPAAPDAYAYQWLYWGLLAAASGIQMAGPLLTPQRYADGLAKARFPNPGAGRAPFYQATVGFGQRHTMTRDLAMIWLNPAAVSPYTNQPPAFCYVDAGTRYGLGSWPKREPAFGAGACR